MAGLGKTTFARKLYNHPSVNYQFDKISWCVISQTYSRHNVLANILIQISSELGKDRILEMEEESIVTHIYRTLKNRRYLIVMDDLWSRDVWDEFLRCFPDDGNGSRILFTTRNKEVAPPNCILYALPSLSDEQCWELLQKKVFDNQPCPLELIESGRKIATSCGGLPLAVVVTAGILSTADKEAKEWEEVGRNLSSYILDGRDDQMMRILKLSYDHLPQHLKPCFLYLGVYPEDQEISARDMMNLWIAEGFIHKENEKNAAEVYLKELIDKSLVMVARRRSDGGPKTCLVHDLLRDLCLKTCNEEMLTRFLDNKYFKSDEDRLKAAPDSAAWMCCQYMRYAFAELQSRRDYIIDVPDMRLLRVLYFDCSFVYLTGSEYLVCLKYLVLGDLPPSICNLVNLEYLRVETDNETEYLSPPIMKMKKLKYMKLPCGVTYGEDCNTALRSKLEFLSYVVIRKVKDEEMLKCSPRLRRLKCFYAERVKKVINLRFFTQLESLTLAFTKTVFRVEMSLLSSIKKLTLVGLRNRLSRKTVSMIGGLENLEVLKLMGMEFEGNRWDTRDDEFQKLRYLKIEHKKDLKWNVESSQCFPKLQHLVLLEGFNIRELPVEMGEIPALQTIEVDGSFEVEESARRIQEEQRDMGNEELRVIRSDSSRYDFLRSFHIRYSRMVNG